MSSNIVVRKPGRPRTGESPGRSIRMPVDLWHDLDKWRGTQGPPIPTRSDAIRLAVTKLVRGKRK